MSTLPQVELAASGSEADFPTQLESLLHGGGVFPLDDVGWIEVRGEDRVRWLNGMVTNSIQALAVGQGCFNFILNAQGRIQGTATAFALPGSILLQSSTAGALSTLLDHFIIMDDVELTVLRNGRSENEEAARNGHLFSSVSDLRDGLLLAGPHADGLLNHLGIAHCAELSLTQTSWQGYALDVIGAHSPLIPRFELWAPPEAIARIVEALAGTTLCGAEAVEALRILEGTPRYGVDIRDRDLPQETNQTRALHFAKGCYLGQEIVERIRSRGNVHRTFGGFLLDGPLPATGSPIEGEGKVMGELTSVAAMPLARGTIHLALGYIRREALERGIPLRCGEASLRAVPLPFKDT